CGILAHEAPVPWVFWLPAAILAVFVVLNVLFVRDTPGQAGLKDFDTGDADWGQEEHLPGVAAALRRVMRVGRMMLGQPAILVIAGIELCSGFVRSSLMDWYVRFGQQTHTDTNFLATNWG